MDDSWTEQDSIDYSLRADRDTEREPVRRSQRLTAEDQRERSMLVGHKQRQSIPVISLLAERGALVEELRRYGDDEMTRLMLEAQIRIIDAQIEEGK